MEAKSQAIGVLGYVEQADLHQEYREVLCRFRGGKLESWTSPFKWSTHDS